MNKKPRLQQWAWLLRGRRLSHRTFATEADCWAFIKDHANTGQPVLLKFGKKRKGK